MIIAENTDPTASPAVPVGSYADLLSAYERKMTVKWVQVDFIRLFTIVSVPCWSQYTLCLTTLINNISYMYLIPSYKLFFGNCFFSIFHSLSG